MADYRTIEAGNLDPRGFTLVRRADGSPITSGTVNWYLKSLTGTSSGKWWRDGDLSWQAAETANAMAHQADGHWTRTLSGSPWESGFVYLEYAKESGDLHVPISRTLRAEYTASADSSRRVSVGTNADKTGYALAAGEHLAITQDVTGALTAQGLTPPRADRLDNLDATISSLPGTGAIVAAVATQLRSEHGSGAWTESPILGPHTLTTIIRSQATSGVLIGARVTLKDGTDSSSLDQKTTDASGMVRMSIDAGSYVLHVGQLAGYESLAAQAVTVTGNQTVTYYLTPLQPGSPASPGLCTVYGYVLVGNTPVAGAEVTAKLVSKGTITDNTLQSIQTLTATSNAIGYFELGLIRSDQVTQGEAEYKIVIPVTGINQTIEIPNQTSVNITELLAPQL